MPRHFLLIDDDVDDSELFLEALAEAAPATLCHHAIDGQLMLKQLRANEIPHPEIIFLDINMPGMNGWQILGALKKEPALKEIPVIMYSTSSATRDVDISRMLGASCFLTKLTDYKALRKVLEQIVASNSLEEIKTIVAAVNGPR